MRRGPREKEIERSLGMGGELEVRMKDREIILAMNDGRAAFSIRHRRKLSWGQAELACAEGVSNLSTKWGSRLLVAAFGSSSSLSVCRQAQE
jgi:hypothetical protein